MEQVFSLHNVDEFVQTALMQLNAPSVLSVEACVRVRYEMQYDASLCNQSQNGDAQNRTIPVWNFQIQDL